MRTRTLIVACLACAGVCAGQGAGSPEPAAVYKQAMEDKFVSAADSGEDFCWHARVYVDRYQRGYERTKDTAWLDWAIKYFDFIVSRMKTGPDGYKGWIGTYEYDKSVLADSHVGDALMAEGMLWFAETALKDPALKDKYGAAAAGYVEIARRDVFEKWDARDT